MIPQLAQLLARYNIPTVPFEAEPEPVATVIPAPPAPKLVKRRQPPRKGRK